MSEDNVGRITFGPAPSPLQRWIGHAMDAGTECVALRCHIEALDAENARLRAALDTLLGWTPNTKGMDPKARAQRLHAEFERRTAAARAALAPQEPTP